MQITFEQLLSTARSWAEKAQSGGWLTSGDVQSLYEMEVRTPAALFESGTHRPLVAAFFGGTGVGKSTLLNRLAGQSIARTGVERPTSREVSLYLHDSVKIQHLPKDFPTDRVRIAYHHDDRRRQVLWIDMPDIDSTELSNRQLVLDWLPHIDVLIYVVSPERYRDDKGWRLLQAHGGEHAWLFVMNQWDRGHPAQVEDFAKLLAKAGFRNPILLRTDSREIEGERKLDDFETLQAILQDMADRHVIHQLELRAEALRLDALRKALNDCLEKLGNRDGYTGLEPNWSGIWRETREDLMKGLEWPIQEVARAFVTHEASVLRRRIDLTKTPDEKPRSEKARPESILWDEWAESRYQDAQDRLIVEAGERGLAVIPLKARLDAVGNGVGRTVLAEGQRSLRLALANPGNALQRFFLKLSGFLSVLLPLIAIGWVSYQVVKGYYESALYHLGYLGTDFAIHSALLIVLSWLLPYFLYRKLKPSAERTAIKGLRDGIALGLDLSGDRVVEQLREMEKERQILVEEGRRIANLSAPTETPAVQGSKLLERVLPASARIRQKTTG
ncbi:GTPase [Methylocaldum szegediense]|uniref:50S ribosome-binding GTPase n=1 Tax=Methylocaldum szegediense TaxID=73780 RepID=A0ABN8X9S7_9GAMM|nr:GTPase [Methylocaldum szegediense]CAI8924208.1 50S ribosome-binding GTPase [Methylocaldum szegediense]